MKHKVGSLDRGSTPLDSTTSTLVPFLRVYDKDATSVFLMGSFWIRQATEVMWRVSQAMTVTMQPKITANDDNFAHGDFALAA